MSSSPRAQSFAHAHDHPGHVRGPHAHGHAGHAHGHAGHAHGTGHGHPHGPPASSAALGWSLLLVFGFGLVEIGVGLASGSLALASDGVHMLADALALGIAWTAQRLSPRGPGPTLSFGWARIEPLAAFANAIFYLGVLGYIVYEAAARIVQPQPIDTGLALPVAIVGLLVNGLVWRLLHSGRDQLNTRAALLHVIGDFAASAIAIVAIATVRVTGWTIVDSLLSLLIAAFLLVSTLRLIRDSGRVLLNGVPYGLESREIGEALQALDGVAGVHDLHVWSIGHARAGLAAHVRVDEMDRWPEILEEARAMLHDRFGITHITLQAESADETGACGSGCEGLPGAGGPANPAAKGPSRTVESEAAPGGDPGGGSGGDSGNDRGGDPGGDPGGAMALRLERELDAQSALVARVLREDIGQQLTTLRTLAASFEARQNAREPQPSELLATLILRQADSLIDSVRALVSKVRPDALSAGGLPEALRALAADWRLRRPDRRIELLVDPADDSAFGLGSPAVETAALQAAAALLAQAFGEGGAASVVLDASRRDGSLCLQLVHDGANASGGAGARSAARRAAPAGVPAWFGAQAARIETLGGRVRVEPTGARGLALVVHLPWQAPAAAS